MGDDARRNAPISRWLVAAIFIALALGACRSRASLDDDERPGGSAATSTPTAPASSAKLRVAPRFDGERAFRDLETQVAFGPRVAGEMGHARTAEWLAATLRPLADRVDVQAFSAVGVEMRNIVASFRPDVRERVLLCAHWDTRPVADRDPIQSRRSMPIDGANDGASGVAVLLELARMFKDSPPAVGVDIALFDGEDWGDFSDRGQTVLLGSQQYARSADASRPRFGILLDMIGDRDLEIRREESSMACCREVIDKVWAAASELGHAGVFTNSSWGFILDDHVPLIQAGFKVIDLIDMSYPSWHTTADTVDKTSAASLAVVGEVVAKVVYDEKP